MQCLFMIFNSRDRRKSLWSWLGDHKVERDARIVLGYFNVVLQPGEKFQGNVVNINDVNDARECFHSFLIHDLGYSRLKFTWSN